MMRRLATITGISLIVIVAALAALAIVPAERDRVWSAMMQMKPAPPLTAPAESSRDPYLLLAAAAADTAHPGRTLPDAALYDRLFKLKPTWAAPYLILGRTMISHMPLDRPQEEAAVAPWRARRDRLGRHLPRRDPHAAIRAARTALQRARALDPDNAAPDYLLAYLALAEHRDDDAMMVLHSALRKNHWSTGERELRIATYQASVRKMPVLEAALQASSGGPVANAELRKEGRVLTGMALLDEKRGKAARAIFLRQSVMHLGELLMSEGYLVLDVLLGHGVWQIGTGKPLTREENAAIIKRATGRTTGTSGAWRLGRAIEHAKREKMVRYLRSRGRSDLAEDILAVDRVYPAFEGHLRPILDQADTARTELYRLMWTFDKVLLALAVTLAFSAACGLVWLALALVRRRPAPVAWARWKWALVVGTCVAASFMIAAAVEGWLLASAPGLEWFREYGLMLKWLEMLQVPAIAICLLALSGLAVTWGVRRRARADSAVPGFGRQCVGTLTMVALPVTAIVALGSLALSVPLVSRAREATQVYRTMIYRGELAGLGVGSPGMTAGHARPAPG